MPFGAFGVGHVCPPAPPLLVPDYVDELLERIGDSEGFGTDRVKAQRLIEKAAGIVNAATQELLREQDLTVAVDAPFVTLSSTLPDLVRVVEVRDGDREIDEHEWETLIYSTPDPLDLSDRIKGWAMRGRDQLLLWPPLQAAATVTVQYAYEPDLDTCAQFDNPTLGRIMELAEMLACVRTQNVGRLEEMLPPGPPAPPILVSGTYRATVGDAIDDLLERAGDTEGFGTSRVKARRLIEKAIGIVNRNLAEITVEASFAVPADTPFYVLSDLVPDLVRVVRIVDDTGEREIDMNRWETILLSETDPLELGERIEAWGMLGADMLFLWPPQAEATTVTLVYAQEQDLTGSEAVSLDQDSMGRVMRVAEMLMSVRTRNTARLAEQLEAI